MSSKKHSIRFWASAWLPVLLGLCAIATESTIYLGADRTSGPLRLLYQALFGQVGNAEWEVIHHLIRKTGHFVGYGVLGLAWLRAWWMTLPRASFAIEAILAVLGTAVVASGDEFHQSFLPNRTGLPSDVLLDCSGAIVMVFLLYFALRVLSPKRLARTA